MGARPLTGFNEAVISRSRKYLRWEDNLPEMGIGFNEAVISRSRK